MCWLVCSWMLISRFWTRMRSLSVPKICYLAGLEHNLTPWGTMGRSRDSWEDTKGHLGVQTWIFIDFLWISGPHFESFSGTLNKNRCFFSCLFPGHFSKRFWGLNLDVSSIWCERDCKNQVSIEVGILLILRLTFDVFGWPWDQFS